METARFIKDIERCPYLPFDAEYDEWNRKDQERLAKINKNYEFILEVALIWRNSQITGIREICEFVIEMLKR